MVGHGLQKLAGKFGGAGLDGAAPGFEAMGFYPGRRYAAAAGATETVGGALLAAGMWTPLGAAMITGAMATAIAKVHAKNGPWNSKGGYELNALIIGAAFALTEAGAGFPAIDGLITKRRKGFGWAVTELAVGVGTSAALIRFGVKDRPTGTSQLLSGTPSAPADPPGGTAGGSGRPGTGSSSDGAEATPGPTEPAGSDAGASTHQVPSQR